MIITTLATVGAIYLAVTAITIAVDAIDLRGDWAAKIRTIGWTLVLPVVLGVVVAVFWE